MSNFNLVILMGRLTRDPELTYTPKGMAVARFGIAVNRKFGEKEDVCFVDVDCFGKTAENVAQYFKKGASIHIQGHLHLSQWDDRASGQKRSKLSVVLDSFQFVGAKADAGAGDGDRTGSEETGQNRTGAATAPAKGRIGRPGEGQMKLPTDSDDSEPVPF